MGKHVQGSFTQLRTKSIKCKKIAWNFQIDGVIVIIIIIVVEVVEVVTIVVRRHFDKISDILCDSCIPNCIHFVGFRNSNNLSTNRMMFYCWYLTGMTQIHYYAYWAF